MIALGRRAFIAGSLSMLAASPGRASMEEQEQMFGLIGKMRAASGQQDALIAILLEGTEAMPGCRSYIVAKDQADADAIWITEVWDSRASHRASLQLPAVRAAIARARPIIAGFESGTETVPVGGVGLAR
jgi:quinol monooxygenase YgiN